MPVLLLVLWIFSLLLTACEKLAEEGAPVQQPGVERQADPELLASEIPTAVAPESAPWIQARFALEPLDRRR